MSKQMRYSPVDITEYKKDIQGNDLVTSTGKTSTEKAMKADCTFVMKPVNMGKLRDTIKSALDNDMGKHSKEMEQSDNALEKEIITKKNAVQTKSVQESLNKVVSSTGELNKIQSFKRGKTEDAEKAIINVEQAIKDNMNSLNELSTKLKEMKKRIGDLNSKSTLLKANVSEIDLSKADITGQYYEKGIMGIGNILGKVKTIDGAKLISVDPMTKKYKVDLGEDPKNSGKRIIVQTNKICLEGDEDN
jgi:vacuolar-type H+-ATPase subunit I/STV1